MRVTSLAVLLTLSSVALAGPAAQADPIGDPTQTSYSLGVLTLAYFPLTPDGQNIDIGVTGDVGDPVTTIRAKTGAITGNLTNFLSNGTRYHGYADASASPALTFHVVDTKEFDTAVPTVANPLYSPPGNPYARRPDYPRIMNGVNICDYVDNRGVSEVWMYAYQGPSQLQIDESKMSGPNGDVSNEWTHDALPVCSRTYTVYTFNYQRGTAETVHSHAHQYEFELRSVDQYLFDTLFEGTPYPQTAGVVGRCGSVHNPPNARSEYDWANPTATASDCLNWNASGTPAATTPVNCATWDVGNPTCADRSDTDNSQLNYIVWWMQNFPGRNNTLTYQGLPMRNWWDVHGNWDAFVSQHLRMTLPATSVRYSFEDGALDGWSATGHATLSNSTAAGGVAGTHALQADFHSTSASDQPYIHVNPTSGPAAGQTLSAYLLVPSGTTQTVTAKLYVQDSAFQWHTANPVTVSQRGSWVQLSYPLSGYTGTAIQVGLQFNETPVNTSTTVYVDGFTW